MQDTGSNAIVFQATNPEPNTLSADFCLSPSCSDKGAAVEICISRRQKQVQILRKKSFESLRPTSEQLLVDKPKSRHR